MGSGVSYLRLAEVVIERLRPVLPARMHIRMATAADVAEINARSAGSAPRFPGFRYDRGVVVVSFEGDPGRRVIQVGPFGPEADLDQWVVSDALRDLADEISEESHDNHESEVAIEDGAIRIWFGVVPPGSPEGSWRDVVPELDPIPLTAITPS